MDWIDSASGFYLDDFSTSLETLGSDVLESSSCEPLALK
jgi:hypothetical protein